MLACHMFLTEKCTARSNATVSHEDLFKQAGASNKRESVALSCQTMTEEIGLLIFSYFLHRFSLLFSYFLLIVPVILKDWEQLA